MIKKLRRKFVLVNMLLVTLVLAATFVAVLVSSAGRLEESAKMRLTMSLEFDRQLDPPRREIGIGHSRPDGVIAGGTGDIRPDFFMEDKQGFSEPLFSISVSEDGTVSEIFGRENIDIVNGDVFDSMIKEIIEKGDEYGIISSEKLRYKMVPDSTGGGCRIAFADRTEELETIRNLVAVSLLVGAGSLLIFLIISICLSRWILRPVERSWRQQTQFVADASHELKTPLTVILANLGIILSHRNETVANQEKWLESTKTEAQRMSGLVNDLLYLAKSDFDKNSEILVRTGLSDAVMSAVLAFEPVAFEQGKTLESDIEEDIYINGDDRKLRQLCMILLDNAVKYSGENGKVRIDLSKSQDKVRLKIRNTGEAIPPEQLEHVFERFYRADESRAREKGGYGLGLAIASSICEAHKARITAASTPEDGTVFMVSFRAMKQ